VSLDNPNTVDAVGIDPDSGHAVLVIQDQMDWSDAAAHFRALQKKISNYVAFIQNGQLETTAFHAKGRPPRIGIVMAFEPPAPAIEILAGVGDELAKVGIDFGYGPLPTGYKRAN
jgi:hypothetical protein